MYRYYSAMREGRMREHQLLHASKLESILKETRFDMDSFASIQSYDETGVCQECPIYFDLDGEFERARYESIELVSRLWDLAKVEPEIFFSGNKGFHLIVDYKLRHPRSGEIARSVVGEITKDLGLATPDMRVYGQGRRLFRVEGSLHSSTGFYKTRLSLAELKTLSKDDILSLSSRPRLRPEVAKPSLHDADESALSDLFLSGLNALPILTTSFKAYDHLDVESEMTPCLKHLILNAPASGERNRSVYILARFFKSKCVRFDDGLGLLLAQPHYAEFNRTGEVEKVFRSVYRGNIQGFVGCKRGEDAGIMRRHCDNLCYFSEKFPSVKFENDVAKGASCSFWG